MGLLKELGLGPRSAFGIACERLAVHPLCNSHVNLHKSRYSHFVPAWAGASTSPCTSVHWRDNHSNGDAQKAAQVVAISQEAGRERGRGKRPTVRDWCCHSKWTVHVPAWNELHLLVRFGHLHVCSLRIQVLLCTALACVLPWGTEKPRTGAFNAWSGGGGEAARQELGGAGLSFFRFCKAVADITIFNTTVAKTVKAKRCALPNSARVAAFGVS